MNRKKWTHQTRIIENQPDFHLFFKLSIHSYFFPARPSMMFSTPRIAKYMAVKVGLDAFPSGMTFIPPTEVIEAPDLEFSSQHDSFFDIALCFVATLGGPRGATNV